MNFLHEASNLEYDLDELFESTYINERDFVMLKNLGLDEAYEACEGDVFRRID